MKTMREHLYEKFPNGTDGVRHEEIAWAIQDWLSCHGSEWTWDDRAAVEEIGEDPNDYMNFDDDQLDRIDDIYGLVCALCQLMLSPLPGRNAPEQELMGGHGSSVADDIAELLTRMGYTVYFPTHVEDQHGERYSDVWEG